MFRRVSIKFIRERQVLALFDYWWFKCTNRTLEQCRRFLYNISMITLEWKYCRWFGCTVYFRVRARKQRNRLYNCFAGLHVKSYQGSLFLEIGCRSGSSHMPSHLSISYNPDYCNTKCKENKKGHRTVLRWDLPGQSYCRWFEYFQRKAYQNF